MAREVKRQPTLAERWAEEDFDIGTLPNGEMNEVVGGPDGVASEKEFGTRDAADARPRTLYVRRDVVNADELRRWAESQGLPFPDDPHVTLIYSRQPVEWYKMGEPWHGPEEYDDEDVPDGGCLVRPGGPRSVEIMGPPTDQVVALQFASTALQWRHEDMVQRGASHDWPDYCPHVTLGPSPVSSDQLEEVVPYRGRIVLGPEIHEETR